MPRTSETLRDKPQDSEFWPYKISLGAKKRKGASDDRNR